MSEKYRITTDYSPVYELMLSFLLFNRRSNLKYLDLGTKWISTVESRIEPNLAKELERIEDLTFVDVLPLLIEYCTDNESVDSFLTWLRDVPISTMFEVFSNQILSNQAQLLLHLEEERQKYVRLLSLWNEQYFCKIDQQISEDLNSSLRSLQADLRSNMSIEEIVAQYVSGLQIELSSIQQIHLIPSYHFKPLHTFSTLQNKIFIWYPVSNESIEFNILTKSKALSDKTRLDIIQLLSKQRLSFTEIVKQIGTAKGNIHHHLMLLRAAGIIRVHLTDDGAVLSTRPGFQHTFHKQLNLLLP